MKILVEGYRGEGKTGVASLIERALHLHGIQARVFDETGEQYLLNDDMARRMCSIREQNVQITIETKNEHRETLADDEWEKYSG